VKAEPNPLMSQHVHLLSADNTCVCTRARARAHASMCATRVVESVHVGSSEEVQVKGGCLESEEATEGGILPDECVTE
jgi:hypothetical protein